MWFALIDGEQELGPLDSSEVLDFYYKDIFSAETLLWRDGLSGWAPITEIEEFRAILFQGLQSSGAMDMTAYEWSATASPELIAGVAQGGETTTGSAPSVEQLYTPDESPRNVGGQQVTSGIPPELPLSKRASVPRSARVGEDQGVASQQRPSTERKKGRAPLIIMALCLGLGAAYFIVSPPPIAPSLSNVDAISARDDEALVDVSAAEERSEQLDSREGSSAVAAPLKGEGQPVGGTAREEVTENSEDFEVELELELELELEPEPEPETETQAVAATSDVRAKSEGASAGTRETSSSQRAIRAARSEQRSVRRPAPRRRSARRPAEAPPPPPPPPPPAAPKSTRPVSLNSQQIRGAIRAQGTPRFKRCVSDYAVLAGQTINIRVRIEKTGRISQAIAASTNIRTAPAPIQSCVIGALRAVRFPPFSGSALSFDLPVEIPR